MNQRFDPSENRNVNPAAWPADKANQPATDPLANQRRPEDIEPRSRRSSWPILIILLAGLVLALLVWLPAELSNDQTNDAATQPSTTEQTTTPPADNTTTTTPPADNSATPGTATPDTNATPGTTTTPNATPATPDTQTPATGTDTQTPLPARPLLPALPRRTDLRLKNDRMAEPLQRLRHFRVRSISDASEAQNLLQ